MAYLSVKLGTQLDIECTSKSSDGSALDLSDDIVTADITVKGVVTSLPVTMTDAENGKYTITLEEEVTAEFYEGGGQELNIYMTNSSGNKYHLGTTEVIGT